MIQGRLTSPHPFDINLDLVELLEISAEQLDPVVGVDKVFATSTIESKFGVDQIALGRFDFLTEVYALCSQHRDLMLHKGDTLFHNYVGVVP